MRQLILLGINVMHRNEYGRLAVECHLHLFGLRPIVKMLIDVHIENGTIGEVRLAHCWDASMYVPNAQLMRHALRVSGKALAHCLRHHGVLKEMRIEVLKALWNERCSYSL
jgi:hypothetical protein